MVKIEQFHDEPLAHYSYAILSDGKVALVDPGRDLHLYEDWAREYNAAIVAVFETHPHADFASCHREAIEKLGATAYIHPKVGVSYPHTPLEHGDKVAMGGVTFEALFTPGHSPDHNSYLLYDEDGKPVAVFTGDSLFIGDVGRPDLREGAGNIRQQKEDLARQMFRTLQNVFKQLPDDVVVYPAHGKGSLCGKGMREESYSTIGQEKIANWAMQVADEDEFVRLLLEGQPFIPAYFPYEVEVNRKGAPAMEPAIAAIPRVNEKEVAGTIVDVRPYDAFRQGHIEGSINIPNLPEEKWETWLGTFVKPGEAYYLVGDDEEALQNAIYRAAKIGYEPFLKGYALLEERKEHSLPAEVPLEELDKHGEKYFIVDVRVPSEVETTGKLFSHSVNIPLHELPERANELPSDRKIAFHCAGGYRSGVGASVVHALRPELEVLNIGETIKAIKERLQTA